MEDEVEVLISIPVTGTIEHYVFRKPGHEYDLVTEDEIDDTLSCGEFNLHSHDTLGTVITPV